MEWHYKFLALLIPRCVGSQQKPDDGGGAFISIGQRLPSLGGESKANDQGNRGRRSGARHGSLQLR